MKNKREKGVPVIQDNGYGGCLYISADSCSMELMQKDMVNDEEGVRLEMLQLQMRGPIEKSLEILTQQVNVAPGVPMLGELRTYRRYSPVDPDDIFLHMVVDAEGKPKKDNGRVYWEYIEYVELDEYYNESTNQE